MTIIANLRHYLDETGRLASGMPSPAFRLATLLCAIVGWTSRTNGGPQRTNVWCRRNPGRKPCGGEIVAGIATESTDIVWECPACGENGLIAGWRDTRWDRSGLE